MPFGAQNTLIMWLTGKYCVHAIRISLPRSPAPMSSCVLQAPAVPQPANSIADAHLSGGNYANRAVCKERHRTTNSLSIWSSKPSGVTAKFSTDTFAHSSGGKCGFDARVVMNSLKCSLYGTAWSLSWIISLPPSQNRCCRSSGSSVPSIDTGNFSIRTHRP